MNREQPPPSRDVLVALNRAAMSARLMSGAVHEVNNALQVISGSVELLEQQPAPSPAVVRSLERIKRQADRAAAALAELQVFTKASLDGASKFSLRETMLQAVALRRYAASRSGLTFEVNADQSASDVVSGNVGYAQQALLNLLVNAEQAMAGAGGTIAVTLRTEDGRAGVEVVDRGSGLGSGALAHLFEPFASTKAPADGAGLGLWAARTLLEPMRGTVDLTASDGNTTAMMWLPRS